MVTTTNLIEIADAYADAQQAQPRFTARVQEARNKLIDAIDELRERVAYLESYTESQKDAMRVTMDELASVREAFEVAQEDRDKWKARAERRVADIELMARRHVEHTDTLKAKLSAMQAQEPAGHFTLAYGRYSQIDPECWPKGGGNSVPLFAAPVAPTQPLTKEQVEKMIDALEHASCHDDACDSGGMFDYSEAIEIMKGMQE